jgi:hypothetical protein
MRSRQLKLPQELKHRNPTINVNHIIYTVYYLVVHTQRHIIFPIAMNVENKKMEYFSTTQTSYHPVNAVVLKTMGCSHTHQHQIMS